MILLRDLIIQTYNFRISKDLIKHKMKTSQQANQLRKPKLTKAYKNPMRLIIIKISLSRNQTKVSLKRDQWLFFHRHLQDLRGNQIINGSHLLQ